MTFTSVQRLHGMLQLEMAAAEWWDAMPLQQKKLYVQAHPHSKFAMRMGATTDVAKRKLSELSAASRESLDHWNNKSVPDKVKSVGSAVTHAAGRVGHHTIHYVKHEAKTYAGAAKAVHHIARGRKWSELAPEHKKGLRNALIHAGLSAGSLAMGDVSGHGGLAIHHVLAEFAHAHAHHAAMIGGGEVGLKTGVDAVKNAIRRRKATAADRRDASVAHEIAAQLAQANIPASEWLNILHEVERQQRAQQKK